MERLDLIRTAHDIDRQLADLAGAVSNDQLKGEVLALQAKWRELSYLVTADFCGIGVGVTPTPGRRRGRPRKASVDHQMNEDGQASSERES